VTLAPPAAFDASGALPGPGVTVLEASAGTGKTYTIAALVARFVADGVPLSEILAVTFTRMATGELRERVRDRLVSTHGHLDRFLEHDVPLPADDAVVLALGTGDREELTTRRDRLASAVSSFDEATITTTHGFCQLVLSSMGVAGGASPSTTLLEDPSDLIEEVVDDLYLRRALRDGPPALTGRWRSRWPKQRSRVRTCPSNRRGTSRSPDASPASPRRFGRRWNGDCARATCSPSTASCSACAACWSIRSEDRPRAGDWRRTTRWP